ncbi:Crp/Fnr family transcriptional regulator [Flavobacterium sp.]|uniref:Crp/Fnr family transcriptional regulator n=1 Tax=Flavobacterium sp. TaxID=239 RepID=UPI00404800AC
MQKLFDHIKKYININENEFQEIASFFETKPVHKKEVFYTPGSTSLKHYFVLEGCVHMYFVNDKGTEQTLQFAIENWWITDCLAFQNNRSSEFFIQAVDSSVILQIGYKEQEELLLKFPKMEIYFRNIYQTAYGAAIMRMKYMFSYSKEEIYCRFKEAFPEFVNNVPQYLVATYLGLSPEYVSKIRRKSIS